MSILSLWSVVAVTGRVTGVGGTLARHAWMHSHCNWGWCSHSSDGLAEGGAWARVHRVRVSVMGMRLAGMFSGPIGAGTFKCIRAPPLRGWSLSEPCVPLGFPTNVSTNKWRSCILSVRRVSGVVTWLMLGVSPPSLRKNVYTHWIRYTEPCTFLLLLNIGHEAKSKKAIIILILHFS